MNSKILLAFILGAAAGSVATWFYTKHKASQTEEYLQESEPYEEDDEYEDVYENPYEYKDKQWDRIENASRAIRTENCAMDSEEEGEDDMDEPCVITPEEFSDLEYEGYATETLTYYADGVLTDFLDEIVENVDEIIGLDSLNRFGEYEQDTVFVRNDFLMTGYEIQRDLRTYAEVVGE